MLVLTRKAQESVVIGGAGTAQAMITLTVLGVEGGKVRLAFQADPAVPIHRREVWQRIHASGCPDGPGPAPVPPVHPDTREIVMRTARPEDRVQVHYTKLFQDGSLVSSRGRAPTELTIGIEHPRLPGLGLALVGLTVGESTRLIVPAERAYGSVDPGRIHRLSRTRFSEREGLPVGKWVRLWDRRRRRRLVRIVEVCEDVVVVDTNHRWAGQSLELEVELISIRRPEDSPGAAKGPQGLTPDPGRGVREDRWLDDGGPQ